VNIIFGTSINEELGDEVVVTVVATGLDSEPAPQTRSARQSVEPRREAQQQEQKSSDPFVDWDMRQAPERGNRESAAKPDNFDNVKKTEFDVFESQPNNGNASDDDQPPFFKRRRNN
jgi:cell division protein FtsZ